MSEGQAVYCKDCGNEKVVPYDDMAFSHASKGKALFLPCPRCAGGKYHSKRFKNDRR